MQLTGYASMMFDLGLADNLQRLVIDTYCSNAIAAINAGDYVGAFKHWDEMLVRQLAV